MKPALSEESLKALKNEHQIEVILKNLENGQWTTAGELFQNLKMSPREFTEIIITKTKGELQDLALLGYYNRGRD